MIVLTSYLPSLELVIYKILEKTYKTPEYFIIFHIEFQIGKKQPKKEIYSRPIWRV